MADRSIRLGIHRDTKTILYESLVVGVLVALRLFRTESLQLLTVAEREVASGVGSDASRR